MKKLFHLVFHRVVIFVFLMLVQLVFLLGMMIFFNDYYAYFYAICTLASLAAVLWIVNNKSNPGYKIAWIILILLLPIFGALFYLLFGVNYLSRRKRKKMEVVTRQVLRTFPEDTPVLEKLSSESRTAAKQTCYIEKSAWCPLWQNTKAEYLPSGEDKFARMLEELKRAEHYIFLEYFIIEEGIMWNSILQILEEKVKQGVEVRLIYDDMGCMFTLPYQYDKKLREKGIDACVFNPFTPVLSSSFNNRDHRKICVIDGYIGFNGGINLADEYINAYEKHGHWKDTAVVLEGDAVWNLTVMFLSIWDYIHGTAEDYEKYRPAVYQKTPVHCDGYIQPYMDNPLDNEPVGENVYFNLINNAKDYVYITTPYLIIDNEMVTALSTAAKSGIDVRIITPHVPDKWYVHAVTRAYYEILVESGVKIYEYIPGFIHAKTFVVDDAYGVVGTINLDYRSLYLHFECGTWMYRMDCVKQMKEDFLETLEVSRQITLEDCRKVKWYRKLGRSILRVFAPLM